MSLQSHPPPSPPPADSAYLMQLPEPTPVPAARKANDKVASPAPKFDYSPLNLQDIRDTLSRLEESIIFALIERAQFKLNPRIYRADSLPIHSSSAAAAASAPPLSVLSYYLLESEKLAATVRRYTSPAEHPFSPLSLLPLPLLPDLVYPPTLRPNRININARVMHFYLSTVLPSICEGGDDENYGSSALCDVHLLQLLSKRIHYGKFVAESKFRSEREAFSQAIRARDTQALMGFITKPTVELQVLARVRQKAAAYGRPPAPSAQSSPLLGPIALAEGVAGLNLGPAAAAAANATPDGSAGAASATASSSVAAPSTLTVPVSASAAASSSDSGSAAAGAAVAEFKVSPEVIAELYEIIMTLNKDVQIEYLMQRLDDEE